MVGGLSTYTAHVRRACTRLDPFVESREIAAEGLSLDAAQYASVPAINAHNGR